MHRANRPKDHPKFTPKLAPTASAARSPKFQFDDRKWRRSNEAERAAWRLSDPESRMADNSGPSFACRRRANWTRGEAGGQLRVDVQSWSLSKAVWPQESLIVGGLLSN